MTNLHLFILLYWFLVGLSKCEFEVAEDEDSTTSQDDEDLEEGQSHYTMRSGKQPIGHRTGYTPSLPYIIWYNNNKSFPRWLYDIVRSCDPSLTFEWRLNQLSKLYKKCDIISGGYPLSGEYIRDLLEMISLQNRIDDGTIIDDIENKEDLQRLRSLKLPAANNFTIRLYLKGEDRILRKVDSMGSLKARRYFPLRYKFLNKPFDEEMTAVEDDISDTSESIKQIHNESDRGNVTFPSSQNESSVNESFEVTIPINRKINNDPISELFKDARLSQENTVGVLPGERRSTEEHTDDSDRIDGNGERIFEQIIDKCNAELNTNRKYKKCRSNRFNKFDIFNKNLSSTSDKHKQDLTGDVETKQQPPYVIHSRSKHVNNLFNIFFDKGKNTEYKNKETGKARSKKFVGRKYDLVHALNKMGVKMSNRSKTELSELYEKVLRNKERENIKKIFTEEDCKFCCRDMRYKDALNFLTDLGMYKQNKKERDYNTYLTDVLENIGLNLTKNTKKKLNKLYSHTKKVFKGKKEA